MKSHPLLTILTIPVNSISAWFWLVAGSGLIQMVTLALIILIWNEWPWRKFMIFAIAIGGAGAFTTALYVALVLISIRFPEQLYERTLRTDATPLGLQRKKVNKDDLPGTYPIAA
jgi:hypothetical protein